MAEILAISVAESSDFPKQNVSDDFAKELIDLTKDGEVLPVRNLKAACQ